jgi:hypothetical protein
MVASELSWRPVAMVQGASLRGLVAGGLEDWKSSDGWGPLPKPPAEAGASRRLILRLRLDPCRRWHPHQHARLAHPLPAGTVGSRPAKARVERLWALIPALRFADTPQAPCHRLNPAREEGFPRAPAKKHLHTRALGRLGPSPAFTYRAEVASAPRERVDPCPAGAAGHAKP